MPKTIAITPSWYWPARVARVVGVPPFYVHEMLVERWARHRPHDVAIVSGAGRLTGSELAEEVNGVARGIAARAGAGGSAALAAGPSLDGVVLLLGAMASGVPLHLVDIASGTVPAGTTVLLADQAGAAATGSADVPVVTRSELSGSDGAPTLPGLNDRSLALPSNGDHAWHSHRSVLAGAISLATFLGLEKDRPWMTTFPIDSWEGLYGVTTPLMAGAPIVLPDAADSVLDAVAKESVARVFADLDTAFSWTREAKREVKSLRGAMAALVVSVSGLFDADQRRRVSRQFESPALTVYGLPETGPIFGSHASWYLDESVGIPLSNAHVVPVDPRSGTPIPTLWEMVESARVTVYSPAMTLGYEGEEHAERFRDGRFYTSLIASSDANGMIYLLPDQV